MSDDVTRYWWAYGAQADGQVTLARCELKDTAYQEVGHFKAAGCVRLGVTLKQMTGAEAKAMLQSLGLRLQKVKECN